MEEIVLHIENLSQWFGTSRILHNLDIKITRGQFVALVGRSGCGKSTLLRAILGTGIAKQGCVKIDGIIRTKPNRDVGMMYQNYNLYPFLTAEQNASFGLKLDETKIYQRFPFSRKWINLRREHLQKAREFLTKFGLGDALGKYPNQLSGGMQQRTSFVQSLIMEPKVLLLDEPFGAQDENTRNDLQKNLLSLYQENLENIKTGIPPQWTVVFITHEINEAFYISNRVIGLSKNWYLKDEIGDERGATVVWDQATPVYGPTDEKDFSKFAKAKEELKQFVLSTDRNNSVNLRNNRHITWSNS